MYLQSRYARVAVASMLAFALTASAGGANGISPLVPASASVSSSSMTRASAMSAGSSASSATAAIPFPAAPDPDPFYRQPNPFPNLANGTILQWRSVTYKPDGTPMPNQAWQLKFASRDGNGQPIAAVATVVKPLLPASGVHPLLAFGFAEDGLGAQCAPSHGVTGSTADSNEQLETTVPTAGLNMGWTVVYPDYEGRRPSTLRAVWKVRSHSTASARPSSSRLWA